jgi:ATP-dependent DNA helicase RecG
MGFKILPGKLKEPIMREVIMHLCDENTLTLKVLSSILERDPKALQDQYLTPMLAEGLFELRYPENKNHPNQAYRKKK